MDGKKTKTFQQNLLGRLTAPFPADALGWRVVTVKKNEKKGLVVPFLDARAIMSRLNEVFGVFGWADVYRPGPVGGVLCGISVLDEDRDAWVTKWDGAENTDIEPVKGGLSSSFRRAAVKWGIGMYLYEAPPIWHTIDDRGFVRGVPRLPASFYPRKGKGEGETRVAQEPRTEVSGEARMPSGKESGKEIIKALSGQSGAVLDRAVLFWKEQCAARGANPSKALLFCREAGMSLENREAMLDAISRYSGPASNGAYA